MRSSSVSASPIAPEIALDAAGRLDLDEAAALGVQLADEISHQRNQVVAVKLGTA